MCGAAGMNEFIEQFLIEGRELVAQGNDDLLALEEQPGDKERLDSAFRAFHTLKGAAGIVDFDAMARALHAAEDVLSAVRSGSVADDARRDRSLPRLPRPGRRPGSTRCRRPARSRATPRPRPTNSSRRFAWSARRTRPAAAEASSSPPRRRRARPADGALSRSRASVLEAQKQLLAETRRRTAQPGRWKSAGRVAANVLRHQAGLPRPPTFERLAESRSAAGAARAMALAIDRSSRASSAAAPAQAGSLPARRRRKPRCGSTSSGSTRWSG